MNQFIKVLKSLFKQLINLKNFKIEQMEIFSVYNIRQGLKSDSKTLPIKVIFFPVA